MKKIRFFLPVFAFGALLFGMAGCDTGNDEYIVEDPTTWCRYSGSDPADNSDAVAAKWTFATDVDSLGEKEASHKDLKLTADDGSKGATLTVGNEINFRWVEASGTEESAGENTARIQASKKSASLENPADGLYLILETEGQTNITVRAKGAGGAEASRILLITDANDEHLVWKNNLYSSGSKYVQSILHFMCRLLLPEHTKSTATVRQSARLWQAQKITMLPSQFPSMRTTIWFFQNQIKSLMRV